MLGNSALLTSNCRLCHGFSTLNHASTARSTLTLNANLPISIPRNPTREYSKWRSHSNPQTADLSVSTDDSNTWEACKNILSQFSLTSEDQDRILGKAFGRVHSSYWGEERKEKAPKYETVLEIVDYLRSLSLSDQEVSEIVKKFPEVLGCELEEEVKKNVERLEREWGIKGKILKNVVKRNPKVLGYTVDCKGDCMALCTRCWARF